MQILNKINMRVLLFVLLVFSVLSLKAQKYNLECKILNTSLRDGEFVDVVFKNNSKYKYCVIIDTLFYSKSKFSYDGNFHNPILFLYSKKGIEVPIIMEVKDSGFQYDSINFISEKGSFLRKKADTLLIDENKMYSKLNKNGFVNTLTIYKIESGKSLQLRIPFNLVVKYLKNNLHEYYEMDKAKKYNGRIEYLIKQEYIEKYIPKEKIDLLKKTGYKIFTGKLISNKVPLIIEQNKKKM